MIDYKKIGLVTLIKILFMMLIIFVFNTYPLFKDLFNGNPPALSVWLTKSFTMANLFFFVAFALYYFYKDVEAAKKAIKEAK